jgi:hypothetical protein
MTNTTSPPTVSPRRLLVWALVAAGADIGAAWLLARSDLGLLGRVAVAVLPVPFNIAVLLLLVKHVRRLDEFQRRVHFEAILVAFISTGLAVLLYGYLQKALIVGSLNVGLVWVPMTVFYCIGYFVAARHYR